MDLMTLLGGIIGMGVIFFVLSSGGMLSFLLNWEAIILIFGGTLGSIMISYPWASLKWVISSFKMVLFPPRRPPIADLIRSIVYFAEVGKKNGIESLSAELSKSPHPFLTDSCQMMLDGVDLHILQERMEHDINTTRLRHQQQTNIFTSAGTFAPIFGLLGTLIGVVQVLRNISNPQMMGSSMAIAMTASFYGIFSANFIFLPIASKLNYHSDEDILSREVISKGVIAIYEGDVPWLVSKKLEGYLSLALRRKAKAGR
ncbi:MAG TPA: MotA/TolQ/ExbB proton channel family protein [Elusimicrobiales bacterium]|nr:MotA/TolQ/ExbB proton channel family protein [Elusimicrobiales bacterium]